MLKICYTQKEQTKMRLRYKRRKRVHKKKKKNKMKITYKVIRLGTIHCFGDFFPIFDEFLATTKDFRDTFGENSGGGGWLTRDFNG